MGPVGARYTGSMRGLLSLCLAAIPLQAEFLTVRLEVREMDCASCMQSLDGSLRKIRGVDDVTVDAREGIRFTLKPGNRITLDRLRDQIKGVGFTPGIAHVKVAGKPLTTDGQWRFAVEGVPQTFNLTAKLPETMKALQTNDGHVVTVEAISPPPPDPRTMPTLDVKALVPAQ